jgi:16S rRNA (guanine966-N2)-methyltransferase
MRIIAGEFRGRHLLPPQTTATRPITDRAKQSLFDVLSPMLAGATVYDCFCGTGSLGLEALSRGAAQAMFFEMQRSALERLRRNIDALGLGVRARVMAGDIFRMWGAVGEHLPPADVVFLDPPYDFLRQRAKDLQTVVATMAQRHLKPGAVMVFRHHSDDALALAPLRPYDRRSYGEMVIELLSAQAASRPEEAGQ